MECGGVFEIEPTQSMLVLQSVQNRLIDLQSSDSEYNQPQLDRMAVWINFEMMKEGERGYS